jgi:serine/threonine protein kinase
LAPTDDDRMLGRLGGYEVVGIVGMGGMGVVLKAFDPPLNRYVAIKILSPHLGSSGAARKRFARESQAAAAVVHDNVIEIYGVSHANGLPYLVMPYVRGPSLERRLEEEGPLSVLEILRIGMQAAAGLATAHAQGLVHRDVKPANILLADGVERVKLTDFGLARAADDASLTKTGIIAGTPQYMSPEQAKGEPLDERSDLFSLGSVLYAMCTGRPPFRAETTYGILRRVTDEEPRAIREINPEIPDWLERVVAKLLSKSPIDRFRSAAEVHDLLEQCLAHLQQPLNVPLPASCRPEPRSSRWQYAGILLVACLAVIGGWAIRAEWLSHNGPPPEHSASSETKPQPSPRVQSDDRDPATAWDATAEEIETLNNDLSPFETRAQKLWDDPTQTLKE